MNRGIHHLAHTWSPFSRLGNGARRSLSNLRKRLVLSREFVNVVRYELEMFALRIRNALSPSHRCKLRGLASVPDMRLNVGCGNDVLEGWVNIDSFASTLKDPRVLLLDLRAPLPLNDESVSFIYCEHFLEHLDRAEYGRPLLAEFARVLKPGGAVRISVPDGRKFIEAYIDGSHPTRAAFRSTVDWMRGDEPWMELINVVVGSGHKYLYDAEVLLSDLRNAGFSLAYECPAGEGRFSEVLMDNPDPQRRTFSLYCEAVK